MHRITLLALLLASLHLGHSSIRGNVVVQAVYAPETLVDQEDDETDIENPAEGSGCSEDCGWVRRYSNGRTFMATPDELTDLEDFLQRSEIDLANDEVVSSTAASQMEDGPSLVFEEKIKHVAEPVVRVVAQGQSLEAIPSSNYYPEYAIGILDNGCTAFLISPFHVITTGHCVYDPVGDSWNEELRFFRGRNEEKFLEMMEWGDVIIPYEFYSMGAPEHNWALITYNQRSPVWIRIAYTPLISDVTYTLYGYLNENKWGGLYCTVCRSDMFQPSPECISMQCGADQKISGGPVMRGYNFQRSKMPLAYGVSVNAEEYSYSHNVVRFNSRRFWTLCYFMKNGSYDPRCKKE